MPSKLGPLSTIPAVLLLSGLAHAFRTARKIKDAAPAFSIDKANSAGPTISIVNGQNARECAFPWQIQLNAGGSHFCGGTLLSATWVLTAAHCVDGVRPNQFNATAGQHNLRSQSGNEQRVRIRSIHMHPRYNRRTYDADIAMLEMAGSFRMNSCVRAAGLPSRDVSPGTSCQITGWGATQQGGSGATILQVGTVRVMSNRDCQSTGYSSSQITPGMLCAQGTSGGRIVDSCQGDSGGPLTCGSTVFGATSWGRGCAQRNFPGVYARVAHYMGWISR